MISEFRGFLLKSEALTLAIGIVVGVALGNVIESFVSDVVSPPLGFLLGGLDFSELSLRLGPEVEIRYGAFVNALISFTLVAVVVFLISRRFFKEELAAAEPEKKTCPECRESVPVEARKCRYCASAV